MGEQRASQEQILKQLVSTFRCHVCHRGFDREHVRVAGRHEQLWIVSVRCGTCRKQQVFRIALKDNQEQTFLRDVNEMEAEQFAAMSPVSCDDVLDIHQFLDSFNGDFMSMFDDGSR